METTWESLSFFVVYQVHHYYNCMIKNEFSEWGALTIPSFDLSRLIENFLSNALKELHQTHIDGKQVIVRFYQNERGVFAFEVEDNAHEFSIDILRKLGDGKNSTNETGDGYVEIFDILNRLKASFAIEEKSVMGGATRESLLYLMVWGRS